MVDDHHLVGHVGDDAEIVGDQQHRHVELGLQVAQQLQDLRLDGDVERRRRLVGDQQRRPADQRHGDHGALAHAARQLERIHVVGALRIGEADQAEHLLGALARSRPCRARPWIFSTSPIWLPIVCSGDSEVIGSWKILPMRLPRSARISGPSRGSFRMSVGRAGRLRDRRTGCGPLTRRRARQDAHDRLADHRFAGAGFADQRRHLARQDAQIGPAHGLDLAAEQREGDAQILDPQQVCA